MDRALLVNIYLLYIHFHHFYAKTCNMKMSGQVAAKNIFFCIIPDK